MPKIFVSGKENPEYEFYCDKYNEYYYLILPNYGIFSFSYYCTICHHNLMCRDQAREFSDYSYVPGTLHQCKCMTKWDTLHTYLTWDDSADIRWERNNRRVDAHIYSPMPYVEQLDSLTMGDTEFYRIHRLYPYFNARYRKNLSYFLLYLEKNKTCNCYWHLYSKFSCITSDIMSDAIVSMNDRYNLPSKVQQNALSKDSVMFDKYWDLTKYGLAQLLYTNCFWYSQYYNSNVMLMDWVDQCSFSLNEEQEIADRIFASLDKTKEPFLELYSKCLSKHPHPKIYYERGLVYNHMGDYVRSLYDMKKFFELCPFEERTTDMYLQEGSAYNECGMYDAAIKSLSTAIELDPENFDAYFERAYAYFETGDFDKSIEDYIASGKESSIIADSSAFGMALTKGLAKGSFQSGKEFVPALLYSVYGIGHGLWSLATDPVATSKAFASSAKNCFLLFMESSSDDKLALVVPEIGQLKKNWKSFSGKERGEALGFIIGKYGIDILMCRGSGAALRYGKSLRKANFSLTLSAMKKSKENRKAIKAAALLKKKQRDLLIKKCNTKIQPDKQGKHIAGHRNYENHKNRDTQSIFQHKKSQKLIDEHVFTGKKEGIAQPGKPGYREVVDFKEFIGWAVDRRTGKKYKTSYGTIHHAKDGVHIVPKIPPGIL